MDASSNDVVIGQAAFIEAAVNYGPDQNDAKIQPNTVVFKGGNYQGDGTQFETAVEKIERAVSEVPPDHLTQMLVVNSSVQHQTLHSGVGQDEE